MEISYLTFVLVGIFWSYIYYRTDNVSCDNISDYLVLIFAGFGYSIVAIGFSTVLISSISESFFNIILIAPNSSLIMNTYSHIFTICIYFIILILINQRDNFEYNRTIDIPVISEVNNRAEAERIIQEKQKEEEKFRTSLIPENYIKKFLQHAERNFEKVDKYGNKNKESLEKEIIDYLLMISKQIWNQKQINFVKAYSQGKSHPPLNDDYKWLVNYLRNEFYNFHKNNLNSFKQGWFNINTMSGVEFERYLANIFKSSWYSVELTPGTWDQWADIIAEKWNKKLIIQAKRYKWNVGNWAVQEVVWAIKYYNGTEWWVITNSFFTQSAKDLARVNNVILIDGNSIDTILELI